MEENKGTLINVKRVREAAGVGTKKDQDQMVLTFDNEAVKQLITCLNGYVNAQVNFDIRVSLKVSQKGNKFPSAFVIVKEMIPAADPRSQRFQNAASNGTQNYGRARTDSIRKSFGA